MWTEALGGLVFHLPTFGPAHPGLVSRAKNLAYKFQSTYPSVYMMVMMWKDTKGRSSMGCINIHSPAFSIAIYFNSLISIL